MCVLMHVYFQDTEYFVQAILIHSPFGSYTFRMLVLAFVHFLDNEKFILLVYTKRWNF